MTAFNRSPRYAKYVLGLLTGLNFFNYVDRLVIVTMYAALREKFDFSDSQLGSFWLSFFVVHALATFPLGWLSDRMDRRKIIGFGVIAWSLATLGSAWAVGFLSLFLLRGVVGIGEAAYNPPSNALLCEIYPNTKSRVIAIYNAGMFAGACAGLAAGGYFGFPAAFQIVAIPGLVMGVLALFLDVPPERTVQTGESPRFASMLKDGMRILKLPTLRWILVCGIFISAASGGYIGWIVDFTTRYKGMTVLQATKIYTVIVFTAGLGGVLLGGLLADRWQKASPRGRTLTIALGFFCATPFTLLILVFDTGVPFFIAGWFLLFFLSFYNGPIAAIIDDVVDDRDAGTAQATFVFFIHVIGTGPGGFLIGFLSNWASKHMVPASHWLHVAGIAVVQAIGAGPARFMESTFNDFVTRHAVPPDNGLRLAFLMPAAYVALAGGAAYMASRHVAADLRRRGERASASATASTKVVAAAASG